MRLIVKMHDSWWIEQSKNVGTQSNLLPVVVGSEFFRCSYSPGKTNDVDHIKWKACVSEILT